MHGVIWEKAWAMREWLVQLRRDFHRLPELGNAEFATSKRISFCLDEMHIPYRQVAGTGLVALIDGGRPGKTIAIRADMDALPIMDAKNVSYKSQVPGVMHACGHDAHVAILLGVGKILKECGGFNGVAKLMFQPAEETVGGAKRMIDEGALEDPKVDAAFCLHVHPELAAGTIGLKYGQVNAASDMLKIKVYGKSAHGAYPHLGVDAIAIAAHIVTGLQNIVSRAVDPRDSAVISLGTIQGGTQGNIIADEVVMMGIVRTLTNRVREEVVMKIDQLVQMTAAAHGGRAEVLWTEGYPELINSDRYVDLVRQNAAEMLGSGKIQLIDKPSMGVEDFAYFLREVPGVYWNLGCGNTAKGIVHSLHNQHFDIDEDCLPVGVAVQAVNVLEALNWR